MDAALVPVKPPSTAGKKKIIVAAPRDFFLGPVFAAKKQTAAREVTIGDRRYQIGGFHPMKRDLRPPALDVRHARAIFSILSFRNEPPNDGTKHICFSLNDLCRRYANSNGGRYSRDIKEIVGDLLDAYIRVTDLKTNKTFIYRIIERVEIEDKTIQRKDSGLANSNQSELWFHSCDLSPEFFAILNLIVELQHVKLHVLTAIRSPLAQAIYLYIPSRAHHHTENDPFEITLTNLLQQVAADVPEVKWHRKKLFTQNANSILQQLDGLETLSGIFRVKLVETADGSDWKLLAWVEKPTHELPTRPPQKDSKLLKAFLKSGRTREDWTQMLTRIEPLSGYETDLLAAAKIDFEKNQRFLEAARAILGESRFIGLLSEAKSDRLEGRKATKSDAARLVHRIMEAIATPKQPSQKR
jgi:hypothetical protein